MRGKIREKSVNKETFWACLGFTLNKAQYVGILFISPNMLVFENNSETVKNDLIIPIEKGDGLFIEVAKGGNWLEEEGENY
jgi:hypothetical protein